MRITDGTVAGDLKVDPYLGGGQWLKANSKTIAEKPIQNNPVYIRTITHFHANGGKKQNRSHYDSFGETFQRRYYGDHMNRLHGHYDTK
jgi:hypothetical protein